MVPNGSAYANYPSYANNGAKTPPGGSPESAKYALGMVPADTFPAEWANWLFHGATAGITRLNADVGSIKKEINSLLAAYNITPDASVFNQLYQAIEKRLSSLYPVGTVYQNADSNKNPGDSDMLGFGAWEPITDKFLAARGSTNIGASGGAWSKTLTEANIPQHSHVQQGTFSTANQSTTTTTTESANHTHIYSVAMAFQDSGGGGAYYLTPYALTGGWAGSEESHNSAYTIPVAGPANSANIRTISLGGTTSVDSTDHTHQFEHTHSTTIGGNTGTYGSANPTAISITPTYIGVYTWKRTV